MAPMSKIWIICWTTSLFSTNEQEQPYVFLETWGCSFLAKSAAQNGECGEDEIVFQEGILLHLDK